MSRPRRPPLPSLLVNPLVTMGHVSLQADLLAQAVRDAIARRTPLEPTDIDFLNRRIVECVRFLDRSLDPGG